MKIIKKCPLSTIKLHIYDTLTGDLAHPTFFWKPRVKEVYAASRALLMLKFCIMEKASTKTLRSGLLLLLFYLEFSHHEKYFAINKIQTLGIPKILHFHAFLRNPWEIYSQDVCVDHVYKC